MSVTNGKTIVINTLNCESLYCFVHQSPLNYESLCHFMDCSCGKHKFEHRESKPVGPLGLSLF